MCSLSLYYKWHRIFLQVDLLGRFRTASPFLAQSLASLPILLLTFNHKALKLSYLRSHFFSSLNFPFHNLFFFSGFLATSSLLGSARILTPTTMTRCERSSEKYLLKISSKKDLLRISCRKDIPRKITNTVNKEQLRPYDNMNVSALKAICCSPLAEHVQFNFN